MADSIQQYGGGAGDQDQDFEDFGGGQVQAQTQSIDDLLNDIDSVLETNAESFVQGFVQKGGQ